MSRLPVALSALAFLFWSAQLSAQPVTPAPAAAPIAGSAALVLPEGTDVETVPADTSREIVKRFRLENPSYREHVLGKLSDTYEDQTPGLRLERAFVGANGTLLEITGLRRPGVSTSAVIRKDTLFILESSGAYKALAGFEGVTELRDRRGGSALVVRPGETLYALFAAVNDLQPFSVEHFSRDSKSFVYFEKLDPRFRERYDQAFATANQAGATPAQLKDFLVGFAKNDPDKRAAGIFLKLINQMRAQNSFEGFYNAYLLIQDPQDAKAASKLAKTDEHRRMMENVAVASLIDKSRLLNLDFRLDGGSTSSGDGRCVSLCFHNFRASRPVSGLVTLKANALGSPIKLSLASYRVVLTANLTVPIQKQRRSGILGNFDGREDVDISKDITLLLSPPSYSAAVPVDMGRAEFVLFDRGRWGGHTAMQAVGNGQLTVTFKSMELAN